MSGSGHSRGKPVRIDRLCWGPRRFPPGVYKHRSIEEAQRQREIWQEQDFQELWRQRGMKPEDVGKM